MTENDYEALWARCATPQELRQAFEAQLAETVATAMVEADRKNDALNAEWNDALATIARLEAMVAELRTAAVDAGASLAAAISLLERGGKAAKKAAPSDRMFDQMIKDYSASLGRARTAIEGANNGRD